MAIAQRNQILTFIIGISYLGRRSKPIAQNADVPSETELLIAKIEHGYICEETGKLVQLPRYARAYARSLALSGGIE